MGLSVDQFVSKYEGKGLDWDGAYSTQCVDLARFYWANVCNIKQPRGVAGAKDFWTNYGTDPNLNQNFRRISNTPDGVPKKGDVMIWGSAYGPWGHIAIFLDGNVNKFTAFSQNDPTGTLSIKKPYKNYFGVLGWFRPNKDVNGGVEAPESEDKMLLEYLGANNEQEAKKRLAEHLGERDGKCDWGNSDDNRGGYLGSSRRRVIDLENENDRLRMDVKHLEEKIENHECEVDLSLTDKLKLGNTDMIANGATVDSDGKIVVNYEVKK